METMKQWLTPFFRHCFHGKTGDELLITSGRVEKHLFSQKLWGGLKMADPWATSKASLLSSLGSMQLDVGKCLLPGPTGCADETRRLNASSSLGQCNSVFGPRNLEDLDGKSKCDLKFLHLVHEPGFLQHPGSKWARGEECNSHWFHFGSHRPSFGASSIGSPSLIHTQVGAQALRTLVALGWRSHGYTPEVLIFYFGDLWCLPVCQLPDLTTGLHFSRRLYTD